MTLHHIDKMSNSPLLKPGPWFQWRIQEREPITRVWGGAPSGDQGQSPGSGASLLWIWKLFVHLHTRDERNDGRSYSCGL